MDQDRLGEYDYYLCFCRDQFLSTVSANSDQEGWALYQGWALVCPWDAQLMGIRHTMTPEQVTENL